MFLLSLFRNKHSASFIFLLRLSRKDGKINKLSELLGKSIKFILLPALIMPATTIAALVYQIIGFVKTQD